MPSPVNHQRWTLTLIALTLALCLGLPRIGLAATADLTAGPAAGPAVGSSVETTDASSAETKGLLPPEPDNAAPPIDYEPWYQVEIILFTNLKPMVSNEMITAEQQVYPGNLLSIGPEDDAQLAPLNLEQQAHLVEDQLWFDSDQLVFIPDTRENDDVVSDEATSIDAFGSALTDDEVSGNEAFGNEAFGSAAFNNGAFSNETFNNETFNNAAIGNADDSGEAAEIDAQNELQTTADIAGMDNAPTNDKTMLQELASDGEPLDIEQLLDPATGEPLSSEPLPPVFDIEMLKEELTNKGPRAFAELGRPTRHLDSIARSISRSSGYRLLRHLAWRQPMTDEAEAVPIMLQLGDKLDDQFEIDGTLRFYRSRFLHVITDLWFTRRLGADESLLLVDQANIEELLDRPAQTTVSVPLRHSRRMRSATLHFVDHPQFGMLIRIDQYDGPEPEK